MFGRRRHVAPVPAAPAPQLTDEQIIELVEGRLATFIGPSGGWSVCRRTDADTDSIFQGVLVKSVAFDIARGLTEARQALETDAAALAETAGAAARTSEPGQHVAPALEPAPLSNESADAVAESEPVAFGWEPAPITVWADLRKPVTAEVPQLRATAGVR